MKNGLLLFLLITFSGAIQAQDYVPLWPEGSMPNSRGLDRSYEEERQRITRVDEPGMYVFLSSQEENKGSAVLICPPGGYGRLAYNIAGFQFAKWLNTLGINAFVLIHRLPTEPDLLEREKAPLQDAQRAMRIIRGRAGEWQLDTTRIGVMGASAGGHLASTLGTHFEDYAAIGDSIDHHDFRPDFMILISPVITLGEYRHQGSLNNFLGEEAPPSEEMIQLYSNERQVSAQTPPAFLVHAQDDPVVPCMNSILFYQALVKQEVSASLHIFPEGKHSIALRNNPGATELWTAVCEAWLDQMGFR